MLISKFHHLNTKVEKLIKWLKVFCDCNNTVTLLALAFPNWLFKLSKKGLKLKTLEVIWQLMPDFIEPIML